MLSPIQIFPVAVLDINLAPKSKYHSLSLSLSLRHACVYACTKMSRLSCGGHHDWAYLSQTIERDIERERVCLCVHAGKNYCIMDNMWVVLVTTIFLSTIILYKNRFRLRSKRRSPLPLGTLGLPFIGETIEFVSCAYSDRPESFMDKRRSM